MFQEINPVFMKETDNNKSWFRDAENDCELFVWKNSAQKIVRFQLWHEDFLIEWNVENGFKSGRLDPEVGSFRNYQSPSYRYHHQFATKLIPEMEKMLFPDDATEPLPDELHFVYEIFQQQNKYGAWNLTRL